jgi:hypothetical protein
MTWQIKTMNFRDAMLALGVLGFRPRDRVLEDAFRAGVVEEFPAGDQSFLHRHFAPGAEPVGQ